MASPHLDANRDLWNHWARLHATSESDYAGLLDKFRAGETTLNDVELDELGDVIGQSLLHLQCHFGLDTLSWARKGATVTGVDFSEEAIALARSLSQESGLAAEFICSDIYDLPHVLADQFDIVYASYGVLPWLPNLDRWAEIVARYLRPGGTFYLIDSHPARRILLPRRVDSTGHPIEYDYFTTEPVVVQERGSYATPQADTINTATYWTHNLGQIVTALGNAGLRIAFLREFPKVAKSCCAYQEVAPGQFEPYLCENVTIPNLFSIRATHPVQTAALPECVAFMLVQDGKILAEKRRLCDEILPGIVAIPGGLVEAGEQPQDALLREAKEELGVTLGDAKYVCSLLYRVGILYQIHYFCTGSWEGAIQAREADALLWIPLDTPERFDVDIDRLAIDEYRRVYQKGVVS